MLPPSSATPQVKISVASSSVGNRETIEDNKSSETVFSGRHMPDAYNSILRPRGIELYGGTETNPKLDIDVIKKEIVLPIM
jgi:hypothetical protein